MSVSPPRLRTIGTWIPLDTDRGRGILLGVARATRELGHVLVVRFPRAQPLTPALLRAREVDGLIAIVDTPREADEVRRLGLPLVNVSNRLAISDVPTVTTDDDRVGHWAARYLLDRGFRTLAYCGDAAHCGSCIREAVMRRVAHHHGAHFFVRHLSDAQLAQESPAQLVAGLGRWLAALPKPVGIFVFADEVCVFLTAACRESGWRIPEEVAVLGVAADATRVAFAAASISSVELNASAVGVAATEMLLRLMEGGRPAEQRVLVPPVKITTRRSTDALAVSDELVMRALDYVREQAGTPITVQDVVRAVAVSRRRLEARFRAAIGRPVYEEIQRQRHERAVQLIRQGQLSLAEIAEAAGYRSARHLSVSFRMRERTTARDFRARLARGDSPAPPRPGG